MSDCCEKIPHEVVAVLDAYPDPAIILSLDYQILATNTEYQQVYGDGSPVPGRNCYEVSHGIKVPCHMAGESCPLTDVVQSKEPKRVLHVHHTPRGNEHVDVEARPVFDGKGEICYLIEIMRKIQVSSASPCSQGLVGNSPVFIKMLELIGRVAASDTSVLLLGESGTGKELVAKAIHDESRRHKKAFVPVDCSSLTENLFESELFGHEKGAFTGAISNAIGLVEAAEGGTLFLDELGDVPLSLQVKLLRLLESNSYRRVGSTEIRPADFRLICATHRDLGEMVSDGRFREDLFYRISPFPVEIPALRERRDDIPLLIDSLLERLSVHPGKLGIGPDALDSLIHYDYPGNIRELRNIIERALLLTDGDVISCNELPANLLKSIAERSDTSSPQFDEIIPLNEMQQRYLVSADQQHIGDRKSLARKLGISESTLYRKLKELYGVR
jgi:transcriptional regulator with PAS, ATPase and Fis domain